jgi:dipeptidyl aminopeptidase/acylaminoacyl peptidase
MSEMKRFSLLILFLFAAEAAVIAQQNLTADILWQLGMVSEPRISPDGKTVIYGVRTADMTKNKKTNIIYRLDTKGGTPVAITDANDNANSAQWRPDGKKIAYLTARNGSMQIWEMNPDGSDKKQVSSIKDGVDLFEYSPDMKHVLYARAVQIDPTTQQKFPDMNLAKTSGQVFDELNIRHWDTWNDGTYEHIFFAAYNGAVDKTETDIMKGEPFDAPLKPNGGSEQIAWTADGSAIAFTCKKMRGTDYMNSTNSDIFLYHISDGKEENLTQGNMGYDQNPAFSPDGKYMAYLSMQHNGYEADKNRLMLMDLSTRKVTDLSSDFDQVTDAIAWAPDSKTIYFISQTMGTTQVYAYYMSKPKKGSSIEALTNGLQDYTDFSVAKDGKKTVLIGAQMTMLHPNELYTIDPIKKTDAPLTFTNKKILDGVKPVKIEKRSIPSTDGKTILTWVIYPPDFDANKKYPTLLYCQGGPQSQVSQFFSTRWNFYLMASHGYIIVAPNRRGLPGFGQAWNDQIVGDYGGQCMRDYNSAIDAVAKEPFVDKNHLGAVGASFGGYSIYWLAGHNTDRKFKVFIAHDGMFNMTSWYGSTEEMWFANHDQNGPYWKNPENYRKFSPHEFVQNWNTPILIISNEKDFRVPFTQGLEAFTAAQEMGIPSRLLTFPDENHWVLKPQNSLLWHRIFYDWLDKYLKPE